MLAIDPVFAFLCRRWIRTRTLTNCEAPWPWIINGGTASLVHGVVARNLCAHPGALALALFVHAVIPCLAGRVLDRCLLCAVASTHCVAPWSLSIRGCAALVVSHAVSWVSPAWHALTITTPEPGWAGCVLDGSRLSTSTCTVCVAPSPLPCIRGGAASLISLAICWIHPTFHALAATIAVQPPLAGRIIDSSAFSI